MSALSAALLPLLLAIGAVLTLARGRAAYAVFTDGLHDGLRTVLRIFPPVAATLIAAQMFRASGALEAFTALLSPVLQRFGLPAEIAPILLLRPLSGSGALACAAEVMQRVGTDSRTGRIAAVLVGGTETTFYVAGVYFGAAGVKHSRHAIPAALIAELAGFLMAGAAVDLLL